MCIYNEGKRICYFCSLIDPPIDFFNSNEYLKSQSKRVNTRRINYSTGANS